MILCVSYVRDCPLMLRSLVSSTFSPEKLKAFLGPPQQGRAIVQYNLSKSWSIHLWFTFTSMDRLMQDQQWQKLILTIQVKWHFPYKTGKGHRFWFLNLVSSVIPIKHVRHSEALPQDWSAHVPLLMSCTLPETNSSPLQIGRNPKGNSSSNHWFSGAMLASGRVTILGGPFWDQHLTAWNAPFWRTFQRSICSTHLSRDVKRLLYIQ